MGLWISRRIIDLHQVEETNCATLSLRFENISNRKGTMGFTSAGLGCGSSFFFELPLYSKCCIKPDATTANSLNQLSTTTSLQHSATPTRHILPIDDCLNVAATEDQSHFRNETDDDNLYASHTKGET